MVHKINLSPTIENLKKWYDKGQLNLNPEYQREGNVWDKTRKERFIYTLLNHSKYVIPTIFFNQKDTVGKLPHYEIVDGKQRLTTILEYISGCKLNSDGSMSEVKSTIKSPKLGDPKYWSKRFDQLDEVTQDSILSAVVSTVAFQQYTIDDMRDIFAVLQEGVPLNQGEKLNALGKELNRAATTIESDYNGLLREIKPNARRSYWNTTILHLLAVDIDKDVVTSFKQMKALLQKPIHQTIIDDSSKRVSDFFSYIEEVVAAYDKNVRIAQHFNEVQLVGLFCAYTNGTMDRFSPDQFQSIWAQFIEDKASDDLMELMKSYKNETLEGSNTPSSRVKRAKLIEQYINEYCSVSV